MTIQERLKFEFSIPFPEELPRLISIEGRIPGEKNEDYNQIDNFFCYLEKLEGDNSTDPVKLIIESLGGNAVTMSLIMDKILGAPYPTYTITRGASSAAALIFVSGAIGHRYIFENSHLMLHAVKARPIYPGGRVRRWISKNLYRESALDKKTIKHYNRSIARFLLEYTEGKILNPTGGWSNITHAEEERVQGVLTFLDRDEYFDSRAAIDYGLADHVINEEMFEELFLK